MPDAPTALAFDADGSSKGELELDPEIFGVDPNIALLHQVVTAQLAGARVGSASTQTRAEARGGGRKPWRQKGLGRARHGSRRSPQWVGGGVAHGPKPRSYKQRTPKKMKKQALHAALSARASEGAILVIDTPNWDEPQTKRGRRLLEDIGAAGKTLVVLSPRDRNTALSLRNLPGVVMSVPDQLTAYEVLWANQVVFTTDTLSAATEAGSYDVGKGDFVPEDAEDEVS
ncbi:MAG: 50S ribosomal protein L4 [Acidimicrobiia bacterium]